MKIKKLFINLGLSCALLTAACESALDVEPEFVKDGSTIFTTLQDYEFNLTGTYALLRQTGYFGSGGQTTSTWAMLPDMMTDNLIRTTEDLSNWLTQVNWGYGSTENDIQVAWVAAYSTINQANLVLRNIDQFAATNAKAVNRIKGQALALRGMAHFDLLRYWGESYDRTSTALGVPYKENVDKEEKPVRLTVQQTYDKIFADMEAAETLLGDVDKAINGSVRANIDQRVVRALLARMHLYAKNYVQAENYATLVLNAYSPGTGLATRTVFPDIWKDASQTEVIWAIVFNSGEGSASAGAHLASSNRNRFRPAVALEALYDQTNDIRWSSYFTTRNSNGGTPRRIINKFYGRGSFSDNVVNWKVIRTAEMYLIRAEARAQQANLAGGTQDINTLRAARITAYDVTTTFADVTALLNAIAIERRKELVGEGHRWFDLKRTALGVARPAADCPSALICNLAPTAKEWTWPVPQVEIDANTSINSQQTTGY